MRRASIAVAVVVVCLGYGIGAGAAPRVIRYQGRLTNSAGQPIAVATDVTFTFYATESGGVPMPGFSDTDTVTPNTDGIYTTLVGDVSPGAEIPAEMFDQSQVYLNVRVGGEDLSPRMLVTPSAYAVQAENAQSLGGREAADYQVGVETFTAAESIAAGNLVALDATGELHRVSPPQFNPGPGFGSGPYSLTAMGSDTAVLAYTDGSNNGYVTAAVATVSGVTVTLGAAQPAQDSGRGYGLITVTNLDGQRFLLVYSDIDTGSHGVVGTVNGSSISFGTPEDFPAGVAGYFGSSRLDDNRAVVAYFADSRAGAVVAIASGDSLSFGPELSGLSPGGSGMAVAALSANKFLMALDQSVGVYNVGEDNSVQQGAIVSPTGINYGMSGDALVALDATHALFVLGGFAVYSCVVAVDGDTPSCGPVVEALSNGGGHVLCGSGMGLVALSPHKALLVFPDCSLSNSIYRTITVTVAQGLVTYQTRNTIDLGNCGADPVAAALSGERVLLGLCQNSIGVYSDSQHGLTEYIGVAEQSAGPGETCRVTVTGGVTRQFSGLTPGATYYVTGNGISLNPAPTDRTMAGKALSADRFVVQY